MKLTPKDLNLIQEAKFGERDAGRGSAVGFNGHARSPLSARARRQALSDKLNYPPKHQRQ
jgi:hypothetical protein